MKDIQVTIYDIVGYFMPGVIATAGTILIFWTFSVPVAVNFDSIPSWGWILGAFASYIAGHLIQALANALFETAPFNYVLSLGSDSIFKTTLLSKAHKVAREILSAPQETEFSPAQLYEICDAFLLQKGKTETRDIYVYREGFYRGLAVAFPILSLGLFLRLFCQRSAVHIGGATYEIMRPQIAGLLMLGMCATFLSFRRYQRFQRYLVGNSIIGAIITYQDADKSTCATPNPGVINSDA